MISYRDLNVLVTGGTRGIGAAVTERLRELGAKVTVTGRSANRPELLAADDYLGVDFLDRTALAAFLNEVEALDRLDVLINNAGINRIDSIVDLSDEDFDAVADVNYRAPYLVMRAAARNMIRTKALGRIVNIGSIWATNTKEGRSAYCAAKSGIVGMTRGAATDLARHGILVNAVSPGFVLTELTTATLGPEGMREMVRQVPLGRLATPDEIARVVAFVASPQQTYLTGQNIIVDGGFTNV